MTESTVMTVTEEDMSKVRQVFDNALNAIVGMSQLSKDVDELRTQVGDLTSQVNRYRNQLDYQEDMLSRAREQRVALEKERDLLNVTNTQLSEQVNVFNNANAKLNEQVSMLSERVSTLSKERDDAEYRVLELTDKLKASEDAHNQFKDRARELAKLFEPSEPAKPALVNWPIAETSVPTTVSPEHPPVTVDQTDNSGNDMGGNTPIAPTPDGYRDLITGQWVKGPKELAREELERQKSDRPWWEKDVAQS